MSGFFGMFNYGKAGPGIDKDGPQKKTIFIFFETFFRNFWKFIPINFIYNVIGLFGITKGIASVGLTNVARNIARDKHSFGLSDFFDTIKANFKQSLIAGIINTIIYGVLIADMFLFWTFASNENVKYIGIGFLGLVFILFTFMTYFMWTLIITFDFKLSEVYKNSYKFAFLNIKNNLVCFVAMVVLYAVLAILFRIFIENFLGLVLVLLILILCVPAYKFLMIQYAVFPSIKKYIIDPYYKEHPEDDVEKRRSLGLDVEDNETETE